MTDIPPQDPVQDPPLDENAVPFQKLDGTIVDLSMVTPVEVVGVDDGTVLRSGDKIVYDYADDGTTFIGWHKEV